LILTYLVVRLDDVVMVEEDDDEVKVVVGTDEVELLKEELESVELELL
jgi:phosphotransferase system IIB component